MADKNLKRVSQDTGVNKNGHLLVDLCCQTGLRMANGRVGKDAKEGKYTYMGARGSSLIDYIIVSQDLLDRFNSFSVGDPNIV